MQSMTPNARRSIFTIMMLFGVTTTHAQDDLMLTDLLDLGIFTINPAVAADGSLAWIDVVAKQICTQSGCAALNEDFRFDLEVPIIWSPDGTWLAFSEATTYESDIWVYDTENQVVTNLTDDALFGLVFELRESDGYQSDSEPKWDPLSNALYFFRLAGPDFRNETVKLLKIGLDGSEPAVIIDFTGGTPLRTLPDISDLSPDGRMLAFTFQRTPFNDFSDGVTIIDLDAGEIAAQISLDAFSTNMPDFITGSRIGMLDVGWLDDEQLIVATTTFDRPGNAINNFYRVEVATGDVIPLFNHSAIPPLEDDVPDAETGLRMRDEMAQQVVILPESDVIRFVTIQTVMPTVTPRAAIHQLSLVDDTQTMIHEFELGSLHVYPDDAIVRQSSAGFVLIINGYLLQSGS